MCQPVRSGRNTKRTHRERESLLRLLTAIGVSLLIIPSGPFFWFVICAIHAGSINMLLHRVAEWEEFEYKWPAAIWVSTIVAVVVFLKVMFFEERDGVRSWASTHHGWWAFTRVVLPGLVTLGVAHGIRVLYGPWFGTILAGTFVFYLIGLFFNRT